MSYEKRFDGRKFDELRPIEAKAGVFSGADGSAMFKIGKTVAFATVFGPRELHPKFLQNPKRGILRCHYNMMPFSGIGERVRPGPNRRAKEISMVTEKALMPVLNLDDYPNTVVDVFLDFPQTDAGSRCAGITAASIALADSGLQMRDLVSSVAVGRVGDTLVVDLDYAEEAYEEGASDIPIAMLPNSEEITLLQMDGEIDPKELMKALELSKRACKEIFEVQKKVLKERFTVEAQK